MTDPWDEDVYLPTWMVDFYGFHVGKYTVRPMHPSWDPVTIRGSPVKPNTSWLGNPG